MPCEVEYTDDFESWWLSLNEGEQDDVAAAVQVLADEGTLLKFPLSSGVEGSRHMHMRELRIQHAGKPYRVLYAFDPRRMAIILLGGKKTGGNKWYKKFVPIADEIYDKHIETLRKEGLI